MNNSLPKLTKCNIFGLELTGFVKNGVIYLNTKEDINGIEFINGRYGFNITPGEDRIRKWYYGRRCKIS